MINLTIIDSKLEHVTLKKGCHFVYFLTTVRRYRGLNAVIFRESAGDMFENFSLLRQKIES